MRSTFGTVIFLNLILIVFGSTPLYRFTSSVFNRLDQPLEVRLYNLNSRFLNGLKFILNLPNLSQENLNLKRQVLSLKEMETKYYSQRREIGLLQAQLKVSPPKRNSRLLLARVLSQKVSEGLLQLDVGQSQAVKVDDLVTVGGVLIGRISRVTWNDAQVLTTVSPRSHLEAATAALSARGEAVGNFGSQIIFGKVLPSQNLSVGETVIDFNSRLILGRVETVRESGTKIFKEAVVTAGYDPVEIVEVFVSIEP